MPLYIYVMSRFRNLSWIFITALSCSSPVHNDRLLQKKDTPAMMSSRSDSAVTVKQNYPRRISALEQEMIADSLVNIHDLDTTIRVALMYSTTNNFLGIDVYGDYDQCYLLPEVARKLVDAQKKLKARFPYYSLCVYDAVRPVSIQRRMWDTLQLPPGEKQKYLSNPVNHSLHNFGAAVDVSIIDQNGIALDMGTPVDFFGELAHPEKEQELYNSGQLTARQLLNRSILRKAMYAAGFTGIQTEWWHFNSCSRDEASKKYKVIE